MLEILAVGIRLEAARGAEEEIIFIRFDKSCGSYIDLDYSIGSTR